MNLKRFFQMILSIVACMLLIISILVSNLLSNQEELNEASKMQNEAANMLSFYRMVNEITVRLIRQYAVTGDEKARQEYDEVIEVLYGKRPWPTGKTMTAGSYMKYLGFPQKAFDLRDEAIRLADPVYIAEDIAYNAMLGKFKDADGKFTIKGDVNQKLAIDAVHSSEYQQTSDKMQPVYEELMHVVAKDKQRQVDELYQASIQSGILILIFSALSIVMLFITYWQVNRKILKPLLEMVVLTESVAQGDLTVSSTASGTDEVGRFGKAFNLMIDGLGGLLQQVSNTVDAISDSSMGLADKVNAAQQRSEKQQNDTEQVASAINQMSATAQEVANNSAFTSKAAHQASDSTITGQKEVSDAINVIDRLANQVEESSRQINTLEKHASSVSNVLVVIQKIAEQTNLLALNAAIEAARAGEQGRGFAVVADEVRTLAQRTQDSTYEIKATIDQLMDGTRSSVTVMENSTKIATEAVSQAKQAGKSLNLIAQSVEQIDGVAEQMATSATEQSSVITEVDRLLAEISQFAIETLDSATHTNESATDLGNMSTDLQARLNLFKFNG
mgnify:CR=1 FL=1